MRKIVRAAAVLGLGILFLTTPARAASTQFNVQAPSHVPIYARGAAAWAPITYTCPARWAAGYAFADVTLTQQLPGHRVAHGYGSTAYFICDDQPHVTVTSITIGNRPFLPGRSARIGFSVQACNAAETNCVSPHFHSVTTLSVGSSPPATWRIDRAALLRSSGDVVVRLHYRCPTGGGVLVGIGITERLPGGGSTHSLDGFETQLPHPRCDGRWHSARVNVAPGDSSPPDPDATPFAVGSAWAHVVGQSYSDTPPFPQTGFEGYRVIQIS